MNQQRFSVGARLALVGVMFVVGAAAVGAQKTFVYTFDSTLDSTFDYVGGETPSGSVVRGAPYSGEGLTTLTQTLGDGTRIERTTTARLYRDSEGRTRREQTLLGLDALNPSGEAPTSITIVDPVAGVSYVLEPGARKARRLPYVYKNAGEQRLRRLLPSTQPVSPPPPPPPPPPPGAGVVSVGKLATSLPQLAHSSTESLGTAKMEGLDVAGQRTTARIDAGRIGNDRPIDTVDERWESSALNLLVLSRHHDPRTGDVEYRLTNVSRAEPSHDLFVVPSDYTIVDARDDENAMILKMSREPAIRK
jgi:hypothetical protein